MHTDATALLESGIRSRQVFEITNVLHVLDTGVAKLAFVEAIALQYGPEHQLQLPDLYLLQCLATQRFDDPTQSGVPRMLSVWTSLRMARS